VVVDQHKRQAPEGTLGFAIVTVSDSRTPETDTGGRRLRELVEQAGHRVERATIVRDEVVAIRAAAEVALAAAPETNGVDILLFTGGTGVSSRDVTPEAVVPLFEKELAGFGELFRHLSFGEVGSAALLSRATAGTARGRAIFLLPGSPAALGLAWEKLILPEARHLIGQARRR
jgi:molybdenum cofactor biosynthesis protein B